MVPRLECASVPVVGWDIRGGAGASAPVSCFADATARASFWEGLLVPSTRAEERRYLAKTVELAQLRGLDGELLAHISTADTARDRLPLRPRPLRPCLQRPRVLIAPARFSA